MLQLKKLTAFLGMYMACICLCACSDSGSEMVLIGSEESLSTWSDGNQQASELEKNYREKSERTGMATENLVGVEGETEEFIRVYVCGAVVKPGVVMIPAGSRVEKALEAAGGFAENANCTYVNLAAWVTDGQMLYFPTVEEAEEGGNQAFWEQNQGSGESDYGEVSLVNINKADVEQLSTLPGIGERRAAEIIAYREANGLFETCEDIMCVPGIKSGLFEKIRNQITVK